MNVYRKLSIKVKMFLVIIMTMMLIVAVAFGSLYYAYSIYDGQLYEKSYRLLSLSSATVDTELRRMEAISLAIIADGQIQQGLKDLMEDNSEYAGYVIRKMFAERLFAHVSNTQRYVESVHLIDEDNRISKYGGGTPFTDEKYAMIVAAAEEANGAVRWLYPDRDDAALILVRKVRSYEPMTLSPIGILVMRINLEQLVEDYAGIAAEESDIVLLAGGRVIYPHAMADKNSAARELTLPAMKGNYDIRDMAGQTMFVTQKQSAYTGWTYYNTVPYHDIFRKTEALKTTLIFVFVVLVIAVVVIGMGFARSLSTPIRRLIGQMKDVQFGDLESMDGGIQPPAVQQLDEVGLLQRTFRLMIVRINTLIKENYANQMLIKETEFKALQAQINPHFLYNTLESIHWLAKKNGQEQISRMVVSLGYLLRSSISLKKNVITVGEELEIVRHYVTIQKYRFRERLDFRLNVDGRYENALIPKLTLQPLLENAILYGLEPRIEPCSISVYCEEEDGKLAIIVEDRGAGMEEEFLRRVMNGEVETRGTGIGLLNIRDRVRLAFGEEYGIRVESREGCGTKVVVLLPLPQEEIA